MAPGTSRQPISGPLNADRIRVALDELVAWNEVARSPQLVELLRYVVGKTLVGEAATIKAYTIAVDVFKRPQGFDPQTDPIVRVQARRLRTLLDHFYETGKGTADVEIRLPLGRYVPEFHDRAPNAPSHPALAEAAPHDAPGRWTLSRYLADALLGLTFTLVGVAVAVVIIRSKLPDAAAAAPPPPTISLAEVDNLTGDSQLDIPIARMGDQLAAALARFDRIELAAAGEATGIKAAVQRNNDRLELRSRLVPLARSGNVWTTALTAPQDMAEREALDLLARRLAGILAHATGPLHAPGRVWVKFNPTVPDTPTSYLCQTMFMIWREQMTIPYADRARDCLNKALAAAPDDANTRAAAAALAAWRAQHDAQTHEAYVAGMTEATMSALRAVELARQSSFAAEQQAFVLARQGALALALDAAALARTLNPANLDAQALHGQLLWISGQTEAGAALAEQAITTLPTPPAWYYLTRALDALQEHRFLDAIDAAQTLVEGDAELGAAIALAASPYAGRLDLIERYRPIVVNSAYFQATGVMPRLKTQILRETILQDIRQGLVLAGIPAKALDEPFSQPGS